MPRLQSAKPSPPAIATNPELILPDILAQDLRIVFCGTAAGRASAEAGAYYAHPGNLFWRTLRAAGLTPRQLRPEEFHLLPEFGLGLTDLAKHHFGNDDELPEGAFDAAALRNKIVRWKPKVIAFTSKNAAQACLGCAVSYGLQSHRIASTKIFVLPSPSGQARRFWSAEPWRALAELGGQGISGDIVESSRFAELATI